jgi:hypothetical protein
MTSHPLTRHQQAQLVLLISHSAGSEAAALDVYRARAVNPATMATLSVMGLTHSKVLRHGRDGLGGQLTVYWLTDEGMGVANRLRDAAGGMTKP